MFTRYYYAILTAAALAVVFMSLAMAFPAVPVAPAAADSQIIKVRGCHR